MEENKTQIDRANSEVNVDRLVKRCGQCLFAEGGDKFDFKNGTTNYRYDCTLLTRKNNIVLLASGEEHFRWENQRACEHFEIATTTLRKREDLDKQKYDFKCDGHFEILPASV